MKSTLLSAHAAGRAWDVQRLAAIEQLVDQLQGDLPDEVPPELPVILPDLENFLPHLFRERYEVEP